MKSSQPNIFEESPKDDTYEYYDYLLKQYKILISKSKNNHKFGELAENLFLGEIDSFYDIGLKYSQKDLGKDLVNRLNCIRFYHYTTYAKLENILKSKQLWLSKYTDDNINDSAEMTYYLKAHNQCESATLKYLDNYFLFCVSCNKDDVTQWDRYGDLGKGVSIEFTQNALCRLSGCYGNFIPVIYNDVITGYSKLSVEGLQSSQNPSNDWHADIVARLCLQRKHPSFKNEKEFRVIIPYQKKYENMAINDQGKLALDIKNELSNGNVEKFINKIILGPQFEKSKQDVVDLFQKYSCQLDINNVEKSKSTLFRKA